MSNKENKLKSFYEAFKSDVKTVRNAIQNRDKNYRKHMGLPPRNKK
jgi:hypothetical protein